jgi:hypothetical protein
VSGIFVPHQAFEKVLRNSGLSNFDWSVQPYYMQPPEPLPTQPFPYVVYEVDDSTFSHTMAPAGGSYHEMWPFRVMVYGVLQIPSISNWSWWKLISPYESPSASIFAFLDTFTKTIGPSGALNGDNYKCGGWGRERIKVTFSTEMRAPAPDNLPAYGGQRVWCATASYTFMASALYPQLGG